MNNQTDWERLKAILLYALMRIETHCVENQHPAVVDLHKLFKVLYFADKQHIAKYGRAITDDKYIAMENGPVPSTIYDIVKIIRGTQKRNLNLEAVAALMKGSIQVSGHYIHRMEDPDFEELSPSEVSCIDQAVIETALLNFSRRSDRSHDAAWEATPENTPIDQYAIARAGGADEEMIKYIQETEENRKIIVSMI